MSGFEKAPPPDLIDYDPSRALHDPASYAAAFAQPPSYVTPHLSPIPSLPSQPQGTNHLHYVPSSNYPPPPASYEDVRSSIIDLRLPPLPEITSYSPDRGTSGSTVYVYLQSVADLLADSAPFIYVMFGSKQCEHTVLTSLEPRGSYFQYALSTEAPPFEPTQAHWNGSTVNISLVMSTPATQEPKAVEVGTFTYTYTEHENTSPQLNSRKRKISADPDEAAHRPAKRPSTHPLQIKEREDYSGLSYTPGGTSPFSPFLPTPTSTSALPYGSVGLSRASSSYQPHASPRQHLSQYSVSSNASQPSITAPSPHTPTWSPSFATVNKAGRSPMTPIGHPSAALSPAKSANPPLIRTSTLQNSPSANASLSASQSSQAFNPYAMYPHKAVLKLAGDLDTMAEHWAMDEWDAKRRLVEFSRRQAGSTIHADFKAIAPEDRTPQSICISCIWWEEKNECYVTSVDTIYLLESLVAVRFTVEEKNRIRRNLEGFRPLTVSKAKPDSEEFFKVIMGFPNPKPRNIEKDVKVFPWKILGHALKKIIGKYSASYSSTAGALLTPVSSSYASTEHSEASNAPHRTASPRSASDSTSTSTYATSLTSTALSPPSHQQLKQSPALSTASTAGPPDLRVTVPTLAPPYPVTAAPYSYQQSPHHATRPAHSHPQLQQPLTAPVSRSSWDFTFMNANPATALPSTSQALNYSRGMDGQAYIPVSYPMSHQTSGA